MTTFEKELPALRTTVYKFVLKRVRNEDLADELTQATMVKAFLS